MEIGEPDAREFDTIVALWDRCGLLRPWNDPRADIERTGRTASARLLVGRHGGVVIATVMAGFDGHRGWIYYLAVDPAHRRRGHARQLLDAATTWLRDHGAPKVQLMVSAEDAAALDFYDALGFARLPVVTLGKPLA